MAGRTTFLAPTALPSSLGLGRESSGLPARTPVGGRSIRPSTRATPTFAAAGGVPYEAARRVAPAPAPSQAGRKFKCNLTANLDVRREVPRVASIAGCSLDDYMQLPVSQYAELDLPLGAYMERVPGTTNDFTLHVPSINVLMVEMSADIFINVELRENSKGQPFVLVKMQGAELSGPMVRSLGLDSMFAFSGYATFRWRGDGTTARPGTLVGRSDLNVKMDPPSIMMHLPTPVLEGAGNTVLRTTASIILGKFAESLGGDFQKWATSPAYQVERAEAAAKMEVA